MTSERTKKLMVTRGLLEQARRHMLEAWNRAYGERVRVEVTLARVTGEKCVTRTRSRAWALGDGMPVALLEGRAGGYALEAMRVICEECEDDARIPVGFGLARLWYCAKHAPKAAT
jgi:hypothetical protein